MFHYINMGFGPKVKGLLKPILCVFVNILRVIFVVLRGWYGRVAYRSSLK